MINIRLPNITAPTEKEQLIQVKSYLHQLAQELNWALSSIESGNNNTAPKKTASGSTVTQDELKTSFNELKSLIIKSSGVVSAYAEAAEERYKSLYVTQSDFGTYTEEASQLIKKNSTSIELFFENMQKVLTDIETLEHSLIEVSARIKPGLLYYDDSGVPVYGLEIGQRTEIDGQEVFNKYARFTSDRLSFYDQNNTEVAYISDNKLYIANIEVLYSIKRGGFIEIILANGDTVTKWVGKG